MSEKEKCLYSFYIEYFDTFGKIPSMRECMQNLGMRSWNGFIEVRNGLERLGFVTHIPYKQRAVRILK